MAVFGIKVVFLQCKGNVAVCNDILKMLRFIDLFAGIGGIRCGFEQAAGCTAKGNSTFAGMEIPRWMDVMDKYVAAK